MSNGFNRSFEKAFISGADNAATTANQTIAERIRKQEEKATKEAAKLQAQKDYELVRSAISKKNPGLAADLANLDVEDMGTETLADINKVLMKQIAPEITKKAAYVIGQNAAGLPETRDAITGQVVNDPSAIVGDAQFFKANIPLEEYIARQSGATSARKDIELEMNPKIAAATEEATKDVELARNPEIAAEVKRAQEEVALDYPTLDDKAKSAVSAYKFISPRIEQINKIVDSGVFGKNGLERYAKQIAVNSRGELVVPDGSPLENVIGLYNDIKLTGFNIAGTAFTGTEKETAFALLDPRAKSDERIKRDLKSFEELFSSRIETGVEGLRGAKKIVSDIKASKDLASMSDEELQKIISGTSVSSVRG